MPVWRLVAKLWTLLKYERAGGGATVGKISVKCAISKFSTQKNNYPSLHHSQGGMKLATHILPLLNCYSSSVQNQTDLDSFENLTLQKLTGTQILSFRQDYTRLTPWYPPPLPQKCDPPLKLMEKILLSLFLHHLKKSFKLHVIMLVTREQKERKSDI